MSKWKPSFDARNPADPDNATWKVGVREAYFEWLRRQNHQAPFARLLLVKESLEKTERIYAGWSRPDKEDCFVYLGRPTVDYQSLSIETPAPPRMVFLVFVMDDGTIDFWNWRELADDGTTPVGVKGEIIWSKT